MDRDEVRADLPAVRKAELDQAAEIIGYDEVVMLGYRDSGMPDSEANARPEAFANPDFDEAVGRLVAELRRTRPQAVTPYAAAPPGYQPPEHLPVRDLPQQATARRADPVSEPGARGTR